MAYLVSLLLGERQFAPYRSLVENLAHHDYISPGLKGTAGAKGGRELGGLFESTADISVHVTGLERLFIEVVPILLLANAHHLSLSG